MRATALAVVVNGQQSASLSSHEVTILSRFSDHKHPPKKRGFRLDDQPCCFTLHDMLIISELRYPNQLERIRGPRSGVRPCHQKSTRNTQLTSGPYVPETWSRDTLKCWGSETHVLHRVDRENNAMCPLLGEFVDYNTSMITD